MNKATLAIETTPTFSTKRLHVWEITSPEDTCVGRHGRVMYMAIVKLGECDWPGIAVTASVWPAMNNEVDWVQTADPMRGRGLAEELLRSVETRLGPVSLTPVSESGANLAKRMTRKRKVGKPC